MNLSSVLRSGQMSSLSLKNQTTTIIPLLSTPLLILSGIEMDPHVAPNKWSRFDLPIVITCTAALMHDYQLLWNGS